VAEDECRQADRARERLEVAWREIDDQALRFATSDLGKYLC
jgi:hypothetical protein